MQSHYRLVCDNCDNFTPVIFDEPEELKKEAVNLTSMIGAPDGTVTKARYRIEIYTACSLTTLIFNQLQITIDQFESWHRSIDGFSQAQKHRMVEILKERKQISWKVLSFFIQIEEARTQPDKPKAG